MDVVRVLYEDIPMWLRDSDLYANLDPGDDKEPDNFIEIPMRYFIVDDAVNSAENLARVLRVLHYWGVKVIPRSVLEFCFTHSYQSWGTIISEVYGEEELSMFYTLKNSFQYPAEFSFAIAISTNRPEIIDFWLSVNNPMSEYGINAIPQACIAGRIDLVKKLRRLGYAGVFV